MCDKLTIKVADREYEKMWVGTNMDEALNILSYRVKLAVGDSVELTDGTEAIIIDNACSAGILTCVTPMVGERYEHGYNHFTVPYNVVKCPTYGTAVDFEDVIRIEGPEITRRLIEREAWQEAADMLEDLRSISVSIEEFSPYLATIYAGIEKDKQDKKDASKRFNDLLEMMRREA